MGSLINLLILPHLLSLFIILRLNLSNGSASPTHEEIAKELKPLNGIIKRNSSGINPLHNEILGKLLEERVKSIQVKTKQEDTKNISFKTHFKNKV